eukprot:GHVU01031965.1.p1 GENE.GHVU01031965.1~~GHVU01031965.1.p1  ORF type:complete len:327 (-),score=40.79 GHVU01031965.1:305-1285(-)
MIDMALRGSGAVPPFWMPTHSPLGLMAVVTRMSAAASSSDDKSHTKTPQICPTVTQTGTRSAGNGVPSYSLSLSCSSTFPSSASSTVTRGSRVRSSARRVAIAIASNKAPPLLNTCSSYTYIQVRTHTRTHTNDVDEDPPAKQPFPHGQRPPVHAAAAETEGLYHLTQESGALLFILLAFPRRRWSHGDIDEDDAFVRSLGGGGPHFTLHRSDHFDVGGGHANARGCAGDDVEFHRHGSVVQTAPPVAAQVLPYSVLHEAPLRRGDGGRVEQRSRAPGVDPCRHRSSCCCCRHHAVVPPLLLLLLRRLLLPQVLLLLSPSVPPPRD